MTTDFQNSTETEDLRYSEALLHQARSLRFDSAMIEREFQESFYGPRAHAFITHWGLLPGAAILTMFCIGDYFGFSRNQNLIALIRVISIVPLLLLFYWRKTSFVSQHIRILYSLYLFILANSVSAIIALTPDTDFAHRGYMLSYPMLIFTIFIAKPRLKIAFAVTIGFTVIFNVLNAVVEMRPLGFSESISHLHFNLVMLTSICIGSITCYVLEVAERRDFAQQKIIRQDKERIELQQFELSDFLLQLRSANSLLEDQNRRLDELNAEKNQFLGIAAHDLKNPLTGINLSVAMIQRNLHRMNSEDVQKTMQSIESSVTRMKNIIVNLLDVNRIERGNAVIRMEKVEVNAVIRQVIADFSERASQKHIELVHEHDGIDVVCKADENVLLQVLDNLVSNALKFSSSHSRVQIMTVSPLLESQTIGTRIYVKDQGPGLNADDMTKLFTSYQRLSAKPTAGEHSSGLGLSIVKKLVESMNGRIWCESEQGKGACFIVELQSEAANSLTSSEPVSLLINTAKNEVLEPKA